MLTSASGSFSVRLDDAAFLITSEVLESTAEAVINSRVLGEVRPMNDQVITELVEAFLT